MKLCARVPSLLLHRWCVHAAKKLFSPFTQSKQGKGWARGIMAYANLGSQSTVPPVALHMQFASHRTHGVEPGRIRAFLVRGIAGGFPSRVR